MTMNLYPSFSNDLFVLTHVRFGDLIWAIPMRKEQGISRRTLLKGMLASGAAISALSVGLGKPAKVDSWDGVLASTDFSKKELGEMEKDWTFNHFAIVTRDIEKAVKYYESCGIGPFEPEPTDIYDRLAALDIEIHGKTATPSKTKMRTINLDPLPIKIEFFQPVEGESLHKEFLEKHGEGVEHIGFFVDDLDEKTARLVEKGFPVVYSGKFPDGGLAFAYFDTREYGNLYLELMQAPVE